MIRYFTPHLVKDLKHRNSSRKNNSPFTMSLEESSLRFGVMEEIHLCEFPSYDDYLEHFYYSEELILSDIGEYEKLGAYKTTFQEYK